MKFLVYGRADLISFSPSLSHHKFWICKIIQTGSSRRRSQSANLLPLSLVHFYCCVSSFSRIWVFWHAVKIRRRKSNRSIRLEWNRRLIAPRLSCTFPSWWPSARIQREDYIATENERKKKWKGEHRQHETTIHAKSRKAPKGYTPRLYRFGLVMVPWIRQMARTSLAAPL